MKILKCDKCGQEKQIASGIVGSERKYMGYETLSEPFRYDHVVDVCESCFKDIENAAIEAGMLERKAKKKMFLEILGINS